MASAGGRTLHVRCNTWEQVEVFHTRKLRRGKLLSMKVPFTTEFGALVLLLTGRLRRVRQAAVHEVLGVARDADADSIRHGWMNLVRRHHPDLVARHNAPAITHLAEELTILSNRAYDRLRVAMVAEG